MAPGGSTAVALATLDDMTAADAAAVLYWLHYAYPASIFAYYTITSTIAICTLQSRTAENKGSLQHPRRGLILILLSLFLATLVIQVLSLVADAFVRQEWLHSQDTTLSYLSCLLVFGTELALLADAKYPVWYPNYGSWILAAIFEPVIFALQTSQASVTLTTSPWAPFGVATIVIWSLRYLILLATLVCYFASRTVTQPETPEDGEREPLLVKDSNGDGAATGNGNDTANENGQGSSNGIAASGYGSTDQKDRKDQKKSNSQPNELPWERGDRKAREAMQKKLDDDGNWFTYVKRFKVFLPYVWPMDNRILQLRAFLVGACLLAGNALNFLIPRQLGIVMDSLSGLNTFNPWVQVALLIGLKWLASEAGLSMLRTWLWMPVEYYSVEAIDKAAYSHILSLSCDFHDSKSASDLIQAISKGESISDMLESICFYAIPMLIDLAIAFLYLSYAFGPYEGFITLTTAVAFLYSTSRLVGGLRDSRREQVNAVYEEHFIRLTGIQGWHTVSQFNQIEYEEDRHSTAVKKKVKTYKSFAFRFYLSRAVQYLVLLFGLLAGSLLAVYQVLNSQVTPGKFVMLLTYWSQLSSPLDFFAGLWKKLAQNLVNAERLLEIMETKPTIVSKELAPSLQLLGGSVTFSDVCFSYDNKKDILKDVSFYVPSGETVAFVGATGAGKSTILKLLNRFYDVTKGSIKVDGQDIRDIDLSSLRGHLGVVPQAPILFNDTVMSNIRYARLTATDEEVFEACKAACIHDQIESFSDGYKTIVGERGVKLSGGELQRVAIARAILKQPEIVLLDEATSAVDTETEQKIQDALKTLCKGRTTFIVAHRLSTVVNADRIIVVGDGKIVEQGTHDELIRTNGKYAGLWSKQIFVKSKKAGGDDSGDSTEADMVDDLTPEQSKEAAEIIKGMGDTDTDASSSSKKKGKTRKRARSNLNPGAPEFTPHVVPLSSASTVQDNASPIELTSGSSLPSPVEEKGASDFDVDGKPGDSSKTSKAKDVPSQNYADGAADDECESADGEDEDKSKSESDVEWSGNDSPGQPTGDSSPTRRVSAPPLKVNTGGSSEESESPNESDAAVEEASKDLATGSR